MRQKSILGPFCLREKKGTLNEEGEKDFLFLFFSGKINRNGVKYDRRREQKKNGKIIIIVYFTRLMMHKMLKSHRQETNVLSSMFIGGKMPFL